MRWRAERLDRFRCVELQGPERQVDPVRAEVAHGAVAEIPPAIPLGTGEIDLVERPRLRRPEPKIPVEPLGDRRGIGRPLEHRDDVAIFLGVGLRLPAPGATDPDVRLGDVADRAGLDQLDDAAVVVAGVNLRSHLRRDLRLGRGLANDPRFPDVVRQRLFAVNMFAELKRGKCCECVCVFTCGNNDGVKGVGLVVDPAEVLELLGLGMFCRGAFDGGFIDVANRDDVFRANRVKV